MLTNYFKLAIRLLIRNPFFTFINVLGLSVGFAVFFILWPFAQSELQSDQFQRDHDLISRVFMDYSWTENGGESWGHEIVGRTFSNVGSDLGQNNEQITDFTRFKPQSSFSENSDGLSSELVIAVGQEKAEAFFKEEHAICADQNLFEFFSIPLVHGKGKTALKMAESIALSEQMAIKFFGRTDPTGKLVRVNGKSFQVTGVFEDLPANSHLQFDMVFSNSGKLAQWSDNTSGWTYNYFKEKGSPSQLKRILAENKERLIGNILRKYPQFAVEFLTQPLDEIVFSENFAGDRFVFKSKFMLTLLGMVSIIVLVMAWMNYINLTISRTSSRFKEIATRKVSGAKMADLFIQFICQSVLINLLAASIGLTIIQMVRQPFVDFLNIRILTLTQLDKGTLLFFMSIFVVGTLSTALYPAWVAVRYSIRQLISKHRSERKRLVPSVLTTIQYATALVLIVWTFSVYFQLDFILKKDIGLRMDHVITIDAPIVGVERDVKNQLTTFVDRLRNISIVKNASVSTLVAGDLAASILIRKRVSQGVMYGIHTHGGVDENFIPLHAIKMLAGRNFNRDERDDVIIFSKYAAERLGFKEPGDAIGQWVQAPVSNQMWKEVEIIGVFADYRVAPFYTQNSTENVSGQGQCLTYFNTVCTWMTPQRISVKMGGDQVGDVIPGIEKIYHDAFPGNVFNWYFLDDHVNRHYDQQKILRNQILFFTLLAIGVACLGLLGMISNKVVEKTKEIGIRKVLGAGIHQVAQVLLNTTIRQVIIGAALGIPVAHYLVQLYLEKFSERISLQWWHYTLPVAALVIIMFGTIASVLWRAARSNPVEALKHE